jgi:Flp pilus assembly protein protease CpaA
MNLIYFFLWIALMVMHIFILVSDVSTLIIPNRCILIGLMVKILLLGKLPFILLLPSLLVSLGFASVALFAPRYLGMGDAKYLLLLSLGASAQEMLASLLCISLSAILFVLAYSVWSKCTKAPNSSRHIAFAPFLALGSVVGKILS